MADFVNSYLCTHVFLFCIYLCDYSYSSNLSSFFLLLHPFSFLYFHFLSFSFLSFLFYLPWKKHRTIFLPFFFSIYLSFFLTFLQKLLATQMEKIQQNLSALQILNLPSPQSERARCKFQTLVYTINKNLQGVKQKYLNPKSQEQNNISSFLGEWIFLDSGNIISDETFCTQSQLRELFHHNLILCAECFIRNYISSVFI